LLSLIDVYIEHQSIFFYIAEQAKCCWLMTAIASHLTRSYDDYFAVARLVVKDSSAMLTLDDGNDNVFASQAIEYTDFPLNGIKLLLV
jgi:hypothetical protein